MLMPSLEEGVSVLKRPILAYRFTLKGNITRRASFLDEMARTSAKRFFICPGTFCVRCHTQYCVLAVCINIHLLSCMFELLF